MKAKCLLVVAVALVSLTGCKPTERNYKAAYDAALAKREKTETDIEIPESGLISLDGPRTRQVGNEKVYYDVIPLRLTASADAKREDSNGVDDPCPMRYNVVVGKYRMATNARSQAAMLWQMGYKGAFPAHVNKDAQYSVAASFDTIEAAAEFIKEFVAAHPDMKYVGLPDAPVVVENNLCK